MDVNNPKHKDDSVFLAQGLKENDESKTKQK